MLEGFENKGATARCTFALTYDGKKVELFRGEIDVTYIVLFRVIIFRELSFSQEGRRTLHGTRVSNQTDIMRRK